MKAAAPSPRPPEPEGRGVIPIEYGIVAKLAQAFRAGVFRNLPPPTPEQLRLCQTNEGPPLDSGEIVKNMLELSALLKPPEGPPDPAPAAASAGLREALNECCNVIETIMEAGILKFNTSTEARHDFRATAARGRAALRAAPLPEQPSDARAAFAGEGALRAQIRKEAFQEAARVAAMFSVKPDRNLHPDIPWEWMSSTVQTAAHSTAQSIAADIAALGEASDTSAPEGPSKAVESGAALAPAQREGEP